MIRGSPLLLGSVSCFNLITSRPLVNCTELGSKSVSSPVDIIIHVYLYFDVGIVTLRLHVGVNNYYDSCHRKKFHDITCECMIATVSWRL